MKRGIDFFDMSELFDGALDIVTRVKKAAEPELISQVHTQVNEIVGKVVQMYNLGEEAAQEIVETLLLVGSALESTPTESHTRSIPVETEVGSFDDLLTMFADETKHMG